LRLNKTRDYVDQVKGETIFIRYPLKKPAMSAARFADQNALSLSCRKSFLAQLRNSDGIELLTDFDRESFQSSGAWPTVRGRVES
jgi:hypothetical protein